MRVYPYASNRWPYGEDEMSTFASIRNACCTASVITKLEGGGEFPFFFGYIDEMGHWCEVFAASMKSAKRMRRKEIIDALCRAAKAGRA